MSALGEAERKRTGGHGLNGLSQHRDFLVECMDPEFGLLNKLLACGALSKREIDKIRAKPTFQDKNEELLEHIARKHAFPELFSSLKASKQEHIVKYLEENGEYKSDFGGCWPLRADEKNVLNINQESLVDLIETCDLVQKMLAEGILNDRQKDFITAKATLHEKNEALLDILRRRSLRDFWKTADCLREANQSHVAKILEMKAVVAVVHANLDGGVVDIAQAEDEIASRIAALLKDMSSEESQLIMESILNKVEARLIGANVGNSVVLYFLCIKQGELCQLREVWTEGTLTYLTERLFNRLLGVPRFGVTVSWSEDEYCRSKEYFEGLEKHSQSLTSQRVDLLDLHLELQDMVLEKTCLLHLASDPRSSHISDEEIFVSVASVAFCWLQRIGKRRFISRLLRRHAAISSSLRKRAVVLRNNQEYLSETIRTKRLLNRLRSSDCETDLQFRSFNRRHTQRTTAVDDILHAARSLDGHRYSAFVEQLRGTNQEIAAEVLETGGVTVRVTLRNEQIPQQSILEQRLVEKLQELRQSNSAISRTIESLLKRLKSRGTELLRASHDRSIVLWILCRTPDALEGLKTAEGKDIFFEDISEIFRNLTLSSGESRLSNIKSRASIVDNQTLCKAFASYSNEITLAGSLSLTAEYFYGITTLDNHIYVLCQSPNSLNVFEDQKPFHLTGIIPLEDIKRPEDIGSSTVDRCLYVTDSAKKCLWKKSKEYLTVWLTDIDWPFTLSVLKDGRILLPRKGQPSHVEIYSRKGVLVQRIQLPDDIIDPLHGVQTRRGNLVISHWWRDSITEGVFELNPDGQVVRHFLASGQDQHLTYPRYLTIDTADRIFVTDFDYNRVIQLDPDLGWTCALLTKDNDAIEYPERLCYDATRRQLLVGHSAGVYVFTLRTL